MFFSNLRALFYGDIPFQFSKMVIQNKDVSCSTQLASVKNHRRTTTMLQTSSVKSLQKFSTPIITLAENVKEGSLSSLSLAEPKSIDARKSKNHLKNKEIYASNYEKKLSTIIKYAKLMTAAETPITPNDIRVKRLLCLINGANSRSSSSAESKSVLTKYTSIKKEKEEHHCLHNLSKQHRRYYSGNAPPPKNPSGGDSAMPPGVILHKDTECHLNNQISAELFASYAYLSLASYFGKNEVGLNGFYNFFMAMSEEETGHAVKLMDYVNLRGGNVQFCPLPAPTLKVTSAKTALEIALGLELDVTCKLVGVHDEAAKYNDYVTMDFIVTEYLQDQYKSIQEIQVFISKLNVGCNCGVAILKVDKMLQKQFRRSDKSKSTD